MHIDTIASTSMIADELFGLLPSLNTFGKYHNIVYRRRHRHRYTQKKRHNFAYLFASSRTRLTFPSCFGGVFICSTFFLCFSCICRRKFSIFVYALNSMWKKNRSELKLEKIVISTLNTRFICVAWTGNCFRNGIHGQLGCHDCFFLDVHNNNALFQLILCS